MPRSARLGFAAIAAMVYALDVRGGFSDLVFRPTTGA